MFAGWFKKPACKRTIGAMPVRTSLNLPDELIKEAMRLTDVKTKTKVIVLALQELIKK